MALFDAGTPPRTPCQGHLSGPRSSGPGLCFQRWGSMFLTHPELCIPSSHVQDGALQAPRGGGGGEGESLSPLGGFSGPEAVLGGSGLPRDPTAGGCGGRRGRTIGGGPGVGVGGECTQAKCSHSRTSGPPRRPSVYLFTFPGSSNTSAFSELGAWGRPWCARPPPSPLSHTAALRPLLGEGEV